MPPKLAEAAKLRLDNPDLTLTELAALCRPPITKSSLSHRLKKLDQLAEGMPDKGEKGLKENV